MESPRVRFLIDYWLSLHSVPLRRRANQGRAVRRHLIGGLRYVKRPCLAQPHHIPDLLLQETRVKAVIRRFCYDQSGVGMNFPESLIETLRGALRVVVFTGAGVSQESGIPTFRDGQTGLWANFAPAELATPQAFDRDPALVWDWYEWRRAAVRGALPNAAHRAIAQLASRVPELTLITQNVDDLHERAGSPAVLHLHGRIARPYCESCRRPYACSDAAPAQAEGCRVEPPRCAVCRARIRPGVVWFGESLPIEEWRAAQVAARSAHLFFCVGTSAIVQPAASLTDLASDAGAVTVQVNPNVTGIEERVSFALCGPAGSVLPALLERAWPGS